MAKYINQFTVNLTDEDAQRLNYLAKVKQRKPAELLRLILSPAILNEFIKQQREEQGNQEQEFTPAHFNKGGNL